MLSRNRKWLREEAKTKLGAGAGNSWYASREVWKSLSPMSTPNFKIITIDLLKRFYPFLLLLFLNCQSSMARKWTEISVFLRAIYNHKKQ